MQKLIAFINWSNKNERQENKHDTSQTRPLHAGAPNPRRNFQDDTRPSYRIGKHSPADIQRAIDLAG